MTFEELAANGIREIAPYLAKGGEAAAGKTGEVLVDAGAKILGWLREKMTGRAKDSLERLESDPDNKGRATSLEIDLVDALRENPKLADELRRLLPSEITITVTQNQVVSGNGALGAQIFGNNNSVSKG